MLAVSTCWKSARAETGDDILAPILDAGITTVELEYRVTEKIFSQMLPALKREAPSVVSVHNYFPLPDGIPRDKATADIFSLSSLDKEERGQAVAHTLRTLEHAHDLGASAVVLHLGTTGMDDGFERLKEACEEGTIEGRKNRDYAHGLVRERGRVKSDYLDAALFSLDKLCRPAERFGIALGIENRYHLREVPTVDEIEIILDRFEGSTMGYWHDVGHAAVQETLYGIGHEELLTRLSPHLVGVHLHDAEGARDHQAPGTKKIDFDMVRKFLKPDTIRVIELAPSVSEDELREAIDFLSRNDLAG